MNYEIIEDLLGIKYIKATDNNKVISIIPTDPVNSDYQAYLASLEAPQAHLTESVTPPVVEESAPEEEAPPVEEETI
jgi:hypothetical protein